MQEVGLEDRDLTRGRILNAAGAAIGQALDLLTVAILLHRIGPGAFGVVVVAQGWTLLPFILESGIGQQLVRTTAARTDGREAPDPHAATAVAMYVVLGLLAAAAGWVIATYLLTKIVELPASLTPDASSAFTLVALGGGLRLASGFVPRVLVGATRLLALRAVGLVRVVGTLLAVLVLVDTSGGDLVAAGWAVLLGEGAAALLGVILVIPAEIQPRVGQISRMSAVMQLREAGPMTAAGGIAVVSTRADPLLVATFLGAAATATYGVVLRFYDLVRSIIELVSLTLMPQAARSIAMKRGDLIGLHYRRTLTQVVGLAWPVAIVSGAFADRLLALVTDTRLPDGRSAVVAAMALAVLVTPGGVAFYVIAGANRVGDVLRTQLYAAGVTLLAELVLLGAVGVGAVFIGSALGAVIVARRYLMVVTSLSGWPARALLAVQRRLLIALAAFSVAVGLIRVSGAADTTAIGGVAAISLIYGVCLLGSFRADAQRSAL